MPRSRNSIQMVPLSHLSHAGDSGDHGGLGGYRGMMVGGDDHDLNRNLRTDEELRQVTEMPEEEEAEALEMVSDFLCYRRQE